MSPRRSSIPSSVRWRSKRDCLLWRQVGGELLPFEDRTSRWHLLADREADDPLVVAGGLDDVLGVLADRPHAGCRNVPPAIRLDVRDDRDQRGGSLVESRRERRPRSDRACWSTRRILCGRWHDVNGSRTPPKEMVSHRQARVISGFRRGKPIEAPRPAAAIPASHRRNREGRQEFVPLPTISAECGPYLPRVPARRLHALFCRRAPSGGERTTRGGKPHELTKSKARDPGGLRPG